MTIYEKNLENLKEYYSVIFSEILKHNDSDSVIIEESVNKEIIVSVKDDKGKEYYLNSRYNDSEMVKQWIEQQEKIKYQEILVVFGLSNFNAVRKMLENIDETNLVLLYEPDAEIFKKIINYVDITDILANGNVMLCVESVNDIFLEIFAESTVTYEKINKIRYFKMWNYEKLYSKSLKKVIQKFFEKIEYHYIERNTIFHFSEGLIKNKYISCRDSISQYSVNQLRDSIAKINSHGNYPAILVSAGPSLDKNIDELKNALGKCFIVAVDTSIKTLLNHGIRPHIVVSVDSHKDMILFEHKEFYNIPLLICDQSNVDITKIHSGKRFYFKTYDSYLAEIYREFKNEEMLILETGGSVANDAFSFAMFLGFKDIIMIGQDLAYPNNKRHSGDAYGENEKLDATKEYYEVEDIYGGKVLTEKNMDMYRIWFENKIMIYDYLNVIDATEGGAKIHGTKIMTLSDAIKEYCQEERDFYKIIDDIKPCYSEEERVKIEEYLDSIPEQLEEIKKKLQNGIRQYDKIGELSRKGKNHTKEYSTLVAKVGELLKYIDNNALIGIVSLYNKKEQYEVKDSIYDEKENQEENIKDIVAQGTKLFNTYIKSIDKFKEELEDMEK